MRKNPVCLVLLQDEEKRKQAHNLLEESAHQGCLASSYLLWESDRKVDVSESGKERLTIGPVARADGNSDEVLFYS